MKEAVHNPHSITGEAVADHLQTDPEKGLKSTEARSRIKSWGANRLTTEKGKKLLWVFLSQFKGLIVYLLFTATLVSFWFGDYPEGVAILLVLLINAIIGFSIEIQALKSMKALKKLDVVPAKIWRDGILTNISSEEIVPGDVIFLEAGDMIPADARLLTISQLEVNESALTGESFPVSKTVPALPENTAMADRKNMLFKGTAVTKGNGTAVITATGMATELGKISKMVQSATDEEIPLNTKLEALGRKLIFLVILILVPIFVIGIIDNVDLKVMLETSIALAVAAIPEGLPIVATIALARGMLKLAKHHVIVKKLAAVETLGSTNVILTDKTGTLTENRLEAHTISFPDQDIEISWDEERKGIVLKPPIGVQDENESLQKLFSVASLCNNASFTSEEDFTGDPLEVALLKVSEYQRPGFLEEISKSFPRIYEEPFDSDKKLMGTLHQSGGRHFVAVKGAAEELLKHSELIFKDDTEIPFTDHDKATWLQRTDDLAKKGLRVLAFAYKSHTESFDHFISNLTFIGIIGFLDPPRKDVLRAVRQCREAGIHVVMVTGDHPETARNIALKTGLTENPNEKVIHGKDMKPFTKLSEVEQKEILDTIIFSRVSPSQKLDLVALYQKHNFITGMTGDGVNDAPALKKADIGIAMGMRGTQVAREAADMVLQDDSFASIAKAIKYGRVVYSNIRRFIIYLLSCNLSEILVIALAGFMSLTLPLEPLQILFLNLVTDVFPALALGMGAGNPSVMQSAPRNPKEPIITKRNWISIIIYAASITVSIFTVFVYCHMNDTYSAQTANNVAFFSLAFAQLLHPLNLIPTREHFFKNDIIRNRHLWAAVLFCTVLLIGIYFIPYTREILSIQTLGSNEWILIIMASVVPLFLVQFLKRIGVLKD